MVMGSMEILAEDVDDSQSVTATYVLSSNDQSLEDARVDRIVGSLIDAGNPALTKLRLVNQATASEEAYLDEGPAYFPPRRLPKKCDRRLRGVSLQSIAPLLISSLLAFQDSRGEKVSHCLLGPLLTVKTTSNVKERVSFQTSSDHRPLDTSSMYELDTRFLKNL